MVNNWIFAKSETDLKQTADTFLKNWEADKHFEIKSSGTTTGSPQLFYFTKQQLIQSAKASIAALELDSNTRALLCLPTKTVGGLMLMARSKVGLFTLYFQKPSSRPLAQLSKSIDFVAMVPTQLQQSLIHDAPQLKQISKILIGGGSLSEEVKSACQEAGLNVWQSYGMTETLSHVALKKISPIEDPNYKALPGITFSSQDNCLVIHYPDLLNAPLQTKDLVEIHGPTTFTWLGRADNAINSGGYKIIPEPIELKIAPYLKAAFFLTGVPDDKWGQIVGIVIEGKHIPELPDFHSIGLNITEVPKKIALLAKFERTETQKIKRQLCAQKVQNVDWKPL
jgi:O-succinylbenzoic acid--CoA ligase